MTQGGYNQLNNYLGNYKLLGEISNRFFKNKLGFLVTANAERVNRSIQTMSAGYGIDSNKPDGDILLNAVNLNNISSIIYRRSAMVSLDYKLTPGTTLMLYGMYNNSRNDNQNQAKSYGLGGAGTVGYNFSSSPNAKSDIFQTALSGESKIKFLNINAEYGVAYSKGNNENLGTRSWGFTFNNASTSAITDIAHRKLTPEEIVPLYTDIPDNFLNCWLNGSGLSDSKIDDKNLTAHLDLTVPFKIGGLITGNVKFGGMYREKNRFRDDQVGSGTFNAGVNPISSQYLSDSLDWIVKNKENNISAIGFTGDQIKDFLNGDFNYGYNFNMDRLNELTDKWHEITKYFYDLGPELALPIIFDYKNISYSQNVPGCMLNDQDITENYMAGYIMPEINFGKYVMLLPGVRLEKTHATMQGFFAMPPTYPPTLYEPVPGVDTSATRSDKYLLPMIHLRIKPTKSFYMHFAYTQTLSRPDFNAISPNTYVNTGWAPFSYVASNPALKPELWTNFDGQFTFHGSKIGLLSVTAFYKKVQDKIWSRTYQRIKGDPKINPFPDNAVVNVTVWENHAYDAYVQGLEFEWQTSFYYLPKPLNYFTLNANYTFTQSQTTYPYTRLQNVTPPGGGRPVATRIDSTTVGPMLYQPQNIANVSLGFNLKGFNVWLSFQYNGLIYTGKNYRGAPRLDSQKDYFYRWDLQLTQKFAIRKVKGFEVVANIANISDFTESQRLTGDIRPTYQENYGMTVDLGLRFRF
jgi:TonB-dependent receptor